MRIVPPALFGLACLSARRRLAAAESGRGRARAQRRGSPHRGCRQPGSGGRTSRACGRPAGGAIGRPDTSGDRHTGASRSTSRPPPPRRPRPSRSRKAPRWRPSRRSTSRPSFRQRSRQCRQRWHRRHRQRQIDFRIRSAPARGAVHGHRRRSAQRRRKDTHPRPDPGTAGKRKAGAAGSDQEADHGQPGEVDKQINRMLERQSLHHATSCARS